MGKNLKDVFQDFNSQIDFSFYHRLDVPHGMPPLSTKDIDLSARYGSDRHTIKTPYEGDGTFVLSYKNREAAVSSLQEECAGEVWRILQVQGARSPKSYRVASSLRWQNVFADAIHHCAQIPDTKVRQIVMPPWETIKNIDGAVSQNIKETYLLVCRALGLRYSEELGLFISDVKKQ